MKKTILLLTIICLLTAGFFNSLKAETDVSVNLEQELSCAESYPELIAVDFDGSDDGELVTENGILENIVDGSYIMFSNIDIRCATGITVLAAAPNDRGYIEIRLGSISGPLLGKTEVINTAAWSPMSYINADIDSSEVTTDSEDIYFVFVASGTSRYLYNLYSLKFNNSDSVPTDEEITVSTLSELQSAVLGDNQHIILDNGGDNIYNFEDDLPSVLRKIEVSGSNNTIDLTGVYINVPVGSVSSTYFVISGNNNIILGGEIEDTYRNGITEITDFSTYNQDRDNLAHGLGGDAVVTITGEGNLVDGLKLTTRGSFPYGYGSIYGIGAENEFGLDKRCGILINGKKNSLDNVVLHQRAFGHGIFMQGDADETVITNTQVDGRVRLGAEFYEETEPYDLPFLSDYLEPFYDDKPIDKTEMHSLCEDGIRMYNIPGSVTIENCTVDQMRGGIRLYLGGQATVNNVTSTNCGSSNYNLPGNVGTITNSFGNFAYAPLSDFALDRNGYNAEWTIIPSPHATGPHNLMDVNGNNHKLIFHRIEGPTDTNLSREIVVTGTGSTIINETEYTIRLKSTSSENTIFSCGEGQIIDEGFNNTTTRFENCEDIVIEDTECEVVETFSKIEAEDFCEQYGVEIETNAEQELGNIGYIGNGDWVMFKNVDFGTGALSVTASIAGQRSGNIEFRLGSITGTLIGTIPVVSTGGWQTWNSFSTNLEGATGVQDLYLVFTSTESGSLFNLDYFQFYTTLGINDILESEINMHPNPVKDVLYIKSDINAKVNIFDSLGNLIISKKLSSDQSTIDTSYLNSGVYIVRLEKDNGVQFKKLIKH
ncbi:carbohydrate-binding protein [Formosa sediminum]|uniref:Carbohydrate-binding protein n=1 Tax=Formosa sediminum TaxID=2594004 RepID=A0A516GRX9_9FLAO|nr:carbohydrate-binding protein [Formosa sediminum]QDO94268.1 carbohydrate-binding protein [Formosa sediminum]